MFKNHAISGQYGFKDHKDHFNVYDCSTPRPPLFLVVLDFNMEYELMKFNLKIENIESAYNDCIRIKSTDSGKY